MNAMKKENNVDVLRTFLNLNIFITFDETVYIHILRAASGFSRIKPLLTLKKKIYSDVSVFLHIPFSKNELEKWKLRKFLKQLQLKIFS